MVGIADVVVVLLSRTVVVVVSDSALTEGTHMLGWDHVQPGVMVTGQANSFP